MGSFTKKITWQGVATGFLGALILGAVLAHGRK